MFHTSTSSVGTGVISSQTHFGVRASLLYPLILSIFIRFMAFRSKVLSHYLKTIRPDGMIQCGAGSKSVVSAAS